MKTALWLVFIVLALPLFAAERPTPPAPGLDEALLKGKTPRQFFAERAANVACTGDLAKARQRLEAADTQLKDMVSKGKAGDSVNEQEYDVESARDEFLGKMDECGICATRPIEQREVATAGRTEIWYVSDGSCQLPTQDPTKLHESFEKAVELLMVPQNYPQKRGGYANILEAELVETSDGKRANDFGDVGSSHPGAFISVRGPELLGIINSFSYFLSNKTSKTDKEFVFTFETSRPPRNYRFPELVHVTAGGTRKKVRQQKISNLFGMWYVTSDGYLRYTTAADFGISLKYIEKLGRRILADTLMTTVEKIGSQKE